MEERNVLLEVKDLKKYYPVTTGSVRRGGKLLRAVDGVDLVVHSGETVGLVGESGCGKSTLGKTILQLEKPTGGEIIYSGTHIETLSRRQMRPLRRGMQIIFQDPYSALNPRMTIYQSVKEPLNVQKLYTEEQKKEKVEEILTYVGIPSSGMYKYPHELSGGQRQRAVIARAMITGPEFIVCDEPVSALDVSIRSQVLNLMRRIQKETGVAYLFISHDLSVVKYLCETIVVMYLGKVLEMAPAADLFRSPLHPYTQLLMASIPVPDIHRDRARPLIRGEIPSPVDPPSGCRFHNRCPHAGKVCSEETPALRSILPGHCVACHFAENNK